ncbi:MAG: hypothetical protein EAZ92_10585 [Candidatus Kapaibacterium sp.]|nr:MAG: hypothetical protein EAZ92_10585 [Candidatus Kapabacteria bacterium]
MLFVITDTVLSNTRYNAVYNFGIVFLKNTTVLLTVYKIVSVLECTLFVISIFDCKMNTFNSPKQGSMLPC